MQASLVVSCHYTYSSENLNIDLDCHSNECCIKIAVLSHLKYQNQDSNTDAAQQQNFLNIIFIYLHLSQWKEGFHHHIYSQNNSTFQMFQKTHTPEPLCRFSALYSLSSHHSHLYLCRLC